MDDAGTGDREAGARTAGQVADRLRCIGGCLLVAHAVISDPDLLRSRGDRLHRKADDPEHVINALLLQAPRHQRGAINLTHTSLPSHGFCLM